MLSGAPVSGGGVGDEVVGGTVVVSLGCVVTPERTGDAAGGDEVVGAVVAGAADVGGATTDTPATATSGDGTDPVVVLAVSSAGAAPGASPRTTASSPAGRPRPSPEDPSRMSTTAVATTSATLNPAASALRKVLRPAEATTSCDKAGRCPWRDGVVR
ncbi:MAG TPA: hypothetical protein VF183_12450 [Acidimicrobiales bacterium]